MDLLLAKLHDPWFLFSVAGQALFTGRFLVQWIASERSGRSVVPDAFWTFSIGGGGMLLVYCLHQWEPVLAIGQASGLVIYLRNFYLIKRGRKKAPPEVEKGEALALIDRLRGEIAQLTDIHDRPMRVEETLERLEALLGPSETKTA